MAEELDWGCPVADPRTPSRWGRRNARGDASRTRATSPGRAQRARRLSASRPGERQWAAAVRRGEEEFVLRHAVGELGEARHIPGIAARRTDGLAGDVSHADDAGNAC